MNLFQLSSLLRRAAIAVAICIVVATASSISSAQVGKFAPGPVVRVTGASSLASSYSGPKESVQALLAGQLQPLSLVSSDFDEDGIADLIVGYAAPNGGFLTWHRGNLEAFSPQTEQTFNVMATGNFQDPVLPGASTTQTPVRPDLLAAGDFYQSGHMSVVAAAQSGSTLGVLAGDGHGNFANPQTVSLPGAVTALAAGKIGATGQPIALLVGVQEQQRSLLLFYRGSAAGLVLMNSYALPAPATALAFGDLDGHLIPDSAAVIAGGQVFFFESTDAPLPALRKIALPFSSSAIALGSFVFDRNRRLQMALLSPDGAIHIMAPGGFDARPWTQEDLKMFRQVRMGKALSPFHPVLDNQNEAWQEIESFRGVAPFTAANRVPLLLRTRSGGSGSDDLTIFNRDADQTVVLSHTYPQHGVPAFPPGQMTVRSGSTRSIVGVVPMRLNAAVSSGVLAISQGK